MCGDRTAITFGTDGWRGVISDTFTFENVRIVAEAVASYYRSRSSGSAVSIAVGYDTRFLSESYARTVSEVLSESGINVILSDRAVPTPTLSFAVKNRKLTAGVMITASHNPAPYNGIKIKTAEGGAAGVDVTRELEKLIRDPQKKPQVAQGTIDTTDLVSDYIQFLRCYVDFAALKKAGFRVCVDAMHGSGDSLFANVLAGTRMKLQFRRAEINPSFGGLKPEPVLEYLRDTEQVMKTRKHDIGLVLDGDADRIAAFAGTGEFINPQKVLGLLILHLIQDRKMSGAIVKTIVGTNLIDVICKDLGLKLFETPVGFKYISELMVKDDVLVGGEEAGGMGFKNYIPERDGTLAGLLLLEMMAFRKKPIAAILAEMEKQYGRYYYLRDEVKLKTAGTDVTRFKGTSSILEKKVVNVKADDGIKFFLEDGSWLILRASGTEPIIRVYAESKEEARTLRLLEFGKNLVKNG